MVDVKRFYLLVYLIAMRTILLSPCIIHPWEPFCFHHISYIHENHFAFTMYHTSLRTILLSPYIIHPWEPFCFHHVLYIHENHFAFTMYYTSMRTILLSPCIIHPWEPFCFHHVLYIHENHLAFTMYRTSTLLTYTFFCFFRLIICVPFFIRKTSTFYQTVFFFKFCKMYTFDQYFWLEFRIT